MLDTTHCEDYLAYVRGVADDMGARASLEEGLRRLDAGFEPERVVLARDFAPYSFVWTARDREGRMLMHGGLIYSGPGAPSDGGLPSLSVSLDDDAARGLTHQWRIHT